MLDLALALKLRHYVPTAVREERVTNKCYVIMPLAVVLCLELSFDKTITFFDRYTDVRGYTRPRAFVF